MQLFFFSFVQFENKLLASTVLLHIYGVIKCCSLGAQVCLLGDCTWISQEQFTETLCLEGNVPDLHFS